jgi:outer membrane protein TolC
MRSLALVMLRRVEVVIPSALLLLLPLSPLAMADDAPPSSSLRYEDAVQLALTRNERAQISGLQVAVAEAAVERARAGFLPVVSISGTDLQHLGPAGSSPSNVGNSNVTVNQPIVNAPAWPLYRQARALADAQHAQNVDDTRLLAFGAANAFFALLNADDFLRAAQRQLDMATANLADTQARAEAGLTSSNDVTRAQIDLASSARQVETDKGILESSYVQLAFTINAPVLGPILPPSATLLAAQRAPGKLDSLVRFAMDHRPDLIGARLAAVAAHDFAGEPLLRLVPTLGVQGTATATTNPPPATGRWNDETVTATLTWTLYDAGVRYADKHSRDAQASIADLSLQQLARSIDAQVRSSVALLVSAQSAFHVAEDAMKAARQSADETAILYNQGLAKAIELIDANDTRFTAEVNYASAEYAMAQAYLNLRQSLGLGPLGTELQ